MPFVSLPVRRRCLKHPDIELVIVLIAAILSGSIAFFLFKNQSRRLGPFSTEQQSSLALAEQMPRKVYRYSIIPGGVENREELAIKLDADPIAADHYSDFRISRTVVVYARSTFHYAYVSYRKGDKIFWTKKRVFIEPEETLLTDGKNFARTRCGNRLSDTPQGPTAESEPAEEEALLFVPTFTSNRAIRIPAELEPAPPLPLRTSYFLPTVPLTLPVEKSVKPTYFAPFSGGVVSTPPTQVLDSPEPNTIILFVSGLIIVAVQRRVKPVRERWAWLIGTANRVHTLGNRNNNSR